VSHELIASAAALLLLIAVHALAGPLHQAAVKPRSGWLSVAGGVAVSFVFLELLPILAQAQDAVRPQLRGLLGFAERHLYLVAAASLTLFYGLESLAARSRRAQRQQGREDETHPGVFWLHMASFGLYNVLIGYLLATREVEGWSAVALYTAAMGLHVLVVDVGLRSHHKSLYSRYGRWLLIALLALGWLAGHLAPLPELVVAVLVAFVAGGMVLNVMKEELPEEQESRFSAFLLGAVLAALLLLAAG
jgi:zinc transporter ZupT